MEKEKIPVRLEFDPVEVRKEPELLTLFGLFKIMWYCAPTLLAMYWIIQWGGWLVGLSAVGCMIWVLGCFYLARKKRL